MSIISRDSDSGDRGVLKRFLTYFKPHWGVLILALIGAFLVGGSNAVIAPIAGMLMDLFSGMSQALLSGENINLRITRSFGEWVIYDFPINSREMAERLIWIIAIATFVLVIFKSAVHFFKEYMLWRVTNKVLMQLKSELFNHIVRLPQSTFDRQKSGEMLSRITYDVTQVENAIRSGINLAKAFIYAIIYVTVMFFMAWWLTLLALMVFPASAVLIKLFGDRIRKISRKVSLNVADYTSYLSEAIGGAKVIKSFGREQDQENDFKNKIKDNYRFSMKIARLFALHAPAQEVFSTLGMVVVILFCGYRMLNGQMTVGDLTMFLVLLTNAYKPIKTLGEVNAIVQRALASSRRIFSLLDQPDEAREIGSGNVRPAEVTGEIEFKDVSFQYYENNPVLKGINLKIKAGETVALVGPSGGGKSTLVSLIPRFYPLVKGKGDILLDGVLTDEWDIKYLRNQMAIVPQETILFSGTIEDNIHFGRLDAKSEEIKEAARAANAHNFIEKLPGGYQSQVGERGEQLSGGQRQRIAIARAILRDPRILLLDEATSALDTESERLIQEALERFRRNRTTIVIAHRLSTVQSADRIAVIVEGRLVEIGSHRELYDSAGVYRKLCDQQLTD